MATTKVSSKPASTLRRAAMGKTKDLKAPVSIAVHAGALKSAMQHGQSLREWIAETVDVRLQAEKRLKARALMRKPTPDQMAQELRQRQRTQQAEAKATAAGKASTRRSSSNTEKSEVPPTS